jgi:hypothetical protein
VLYRQQVNVTLAGNIERMALFTDQLLLLLRQWQAIDGACQDGGL